MGSDLLGHVLMGRPRIPIAERFWPKVTLSEGCWEWTGALSIGGYGVIPARPCAIYAHRCAYQLLVGPVPDGLELDHLCRNRKCVNPAHLEPVTHRENVLRGLRGRMVTHCPHGHEYTPDNLYWHHGRRECRTCVLRRNATARAQRQAGRAIQIGAA